MEVPDGLVVTSTISMGILEFLDWTIRPDDIIIHPFAWARFFPAICKYVD